MKTWKNNDVGFFLMDGVLELSPNTDQRVRLHISQHAIDCKTVAFTSLERL